METKLNNKNNESVKSETIDGKELSQPLLETDTRDNKPPLAGPEIDDLDDEEVSLTPYPGIDDGFFDIQPRAGGDGEDQPDGRNIPRRPSLPRTPQDPNDIDKQPNYPVFPYAPGFGIDIDPTVTNTDSIPDVNVYQHKKTLAQGMMDLALFSANANQLRYVLESYERHPYFYPSLVLISISLIFQVTYKVAVGVGLIWNSRYNVKNEREICIANKISNFTIIGIFLITVVNVFISAFGVASVTPTK